jgi:hypothetical protein
MIMCGPHCADFKKDQLSGARAVDVDGDYTSAEEIRSLKRQGKLVICYLSAGSVEMYRKDAYVRFAAPVRFACTACFQHGWRTFIAN